MKQIKFYEKWKDESKTTKTRRGILIIIYMIVSIVLFIFVVAATRIAVVGLAYGVTFIPYVGWALAIGIGVADYI